MDWENVFNDGPDCAEVDFIIMIHPKNEPSAVISFNFCTILYGSILNHEKNLLDF